MSPVLSAFHCAFSERPMETLSRHVSKWTSEHVPRIQKEIPILKALTQRWEYKIWEWI